MSALDTSTLGRKDWDYVSMEDYSKDTKDLTDTTAAIIANQKQEIERLRRLVIVLVHSVGKIEIWPGDLVRMRTDSEIVRYEDIETGMQVFLSRRERHG